MNFNRASVLDYVQDIIDTADSAEYSQDLGLISYMQSTVDGCGYWLSYGRMTPETAAVAELLGGSGYSYCDTSDFKRINADSVAAKTYLELQLVSSR